MARIAVTRLAAAVPVFLLVTVVIVLMLHLAPGDPAEMMLGQQATTEQLDALRDRLGLNDPLLVQYGRWMRQLAQGDMGTSLSSAQPVLGTIVDRLPVTFSVAAGGVLVGLLIALPAGILAALNRGGLIDRAVIMFTTTGIAAPSFFVGLVLVLVFTFKLEWFPATGYTALTQDPFMWLRHLVLPSVTLGVALAAELARHLRASLRDVLLKDYIRTAESKGLSGARVVVKHALKNAAIPVVTVLGIQIRALLGGAIVVEAVFALPGLGTLAVSSVFQRDIPMIQGIAVVVVGIVIVVNLAVDVSYGYLNPRVRLG